MTTGLTFASLTELAGKLRKARYLFNPALFPEELPEV
jgi:hypothetical protein